MPVSKSLCEAAWVSNFIPSHPSKQWYSITLKSREDSLAEKLTFVCVATFCFGKFQYAFSNALISLQSAVFDSGYLFSINIFHVFYTVCSFLLSGQMVRSQTVRERERERKNKDTQI